MTWRNISESGNDCQLKAKKYYRRGGNLVKYLFEGVSGCHYVAENRKYLSAILKAKHGWHAAKARKCRHGEKKIRVASGNGEISLQWPLAMAVNINNAAGAGRETIIAGVMKTINQVMA